VLKLTQENEVINLSKATDKWRSSSWDI